MAEGKGARTRLHIKIGIHPPEVVVILDGRVPEYVVLEESAHVQVIHVVQPPGGGAACSAMRRVLFKRLAERFPIFQVHLGARKHNRPARVRLWRGVRRKACSAEGACVSLLTS